MPTTVELDWETYGGQDLPRVGLDRYTADPTFEILMGAYSFDRGPIRHWDSNNGSPPRELVEALEDPHVIKWAFNAQFERVTALRAGLAKTTTKGWRCTAVMAALAAFNGPLGEVGERLGLSEDKQKDKRGRQLIEMFSKPQRVTKANPHIRRTKTTNPGEWAEFCAYNVQDVQAERAVRDRLSPYIPADAWGEWELYEIDQRINDTGWPVNLEFCRQAVKLAARRRAELTEQLQDLTGLSNPGSVAQLLPWLQDRGYPYQDLQSGSVIKTLVAHANKPVLTEEAERGLRLRQWQARMSVKKFDRLLSDVGPGDRVRFLYKMAGAGRTGRWSGAQAQPQNLPRTPKILEKPGALDAANRLIETGSYYGLRVFIREPMEALVGCVRSALQAPEGYEFRVADLASIETAVIAWITGCEPLLGVFRQGLDPYKVFATHLFNKPYEEVTRAERGFCKPPVLGCGYRLGGGTLLNGVRTGLWGYAEALGVDMTREEAQRAVGVYRSQYPEVVDFWTALENGAQRVMESGGKTKVGPLTFERRSPFLLLRLPLNDRPLFYYRPAMGWRRVLSGRMVERQSRGWDLDGAPEGETIIVEDTWMAYGLSYSGKNQKTRQWCRIDTHGGRTIEQATQGLARDILAVGIKRAHQDGFTVIGHSHDEVVTLQRKDDHCHTAERLAGLMTAPIPGLEGLPLGAASFVSDYYRKD